MVHWNRSNKVLSSLLFSCHFRSEEGKDSQNPFPIPLSAIPSHPKEPEKQYGPERSNPLVPYKREKSRPTLLVLVRGISNHLPSELMNYTPARPESETGTNDLGNEENEQYRESDEHGE